MVKTACEHSAHRRFFGSAGKSNTVDHKSFFGNKTPDKLRFVYLGYEGGKLFLKD